MEIKLLILHWVWYQIRVNREELSEVSMNIITYAGEAKSLAIEALRSFKNIGLEGALNILKKAKEKMNLAQNWHFKVLTIDSNEKLDKINVLFLHAEDQFLSADTIIILVEELINLKENYIN